jgi:chemotaxis protein CheZ
MVGAHEKRNSALIAAEVKPAVTGKLWGPIVQRKVFRIEQAFGKSRAAAPAAPRSVGDDLKTLQTLAERHDEQAIDAMSMLKAELSQIRDSIARNKRDLGQLIGEGKDRRIARAADELAAAVDGMEKATVGILKSVEVVDESAKALTATLKDDYKRGLAQDIQDHVVKIYEACNFQDLAGQRIGNVIRTLNSLEEQIAAIIARSPGSGKTTAPVKAKPASGLLNGPKIDGDDGHASQHDVDKMFG